MESRMKRIAVLTSGGDAPGMNACIRAIVKSADKDKIEVVGILDGFQGLIEGRHIKLNSDAVNNCIHLGGTLLGTARSKAFHTSDGRKEAMLFLKEMAIDALIAIGGDGTFKGLSILSHEMNIPVMGIPGTIDNDIMGTDQTIGFDSCLNTIVQSIDKIRDTASSHHRVFFVEVMGKNSGCVALNAALASGAEDVLIPEEFTNIEQLADHIKYQNKGKRSSIVVVAEGDDAGGAKQILEKVSPLLPEYELRYSVLGHIQRGGSPSAKDRILATRLGDFAVGKLVSGEINKMVGTQSEALIALDIDLGVNSSIDLTSDYRDLLKRMRT